MNLGNILRLADAVEDATVFDMSDHMTCICAVAARLEGRKPGSETYNGTDLLAFMGVTPADYQRYDEVRSGIVCGLGCATKLEAITREQAATMLRHFATTGIVDWHA